MRTVRPSTTNWIRGARWSDGVPVTADDFCSTASCIISEFIVDPSVQNYYTTIIADVRKHDDYTISVEGFVPKPQEEMLYEFGDVALAAALSQARRQLGQGLRLAHRAEHRPVPDLSPREGPLHRVKRVENWWGERPQVLQEPLQRRHDSTRRHPRHQRRVRVLSARRDRPVPVRYESGALARQSARRDLRQGLCGPHSVLQRRAALRARLLAQSR